MACSDYLKILFVALCVGLSGCTHKQKEQVTPIGPDVKANLVIYYNTGVEDQQIELFLNTVLSAPHPSGRGFWPLPGLRDKLRVFPPVQGHESTAITFFADATEAQRQEIKSRALSSPIVYRVLEDIAPSEVKRFD